MPKRSDTQLRKTTPLSRGGVELARRAQAATPRLSLLIYHRDGSQVVPLAPDQPIVIGRAAPSHVVIRDSSLSRQHARFTFEKGAIAVEDLGSTNGTLVRGKLVEHAILRPGETVSLGGILVSPHMRSAVEPPIHGIESHDDFCGVLRRELERARFFGESVSLLMVRSAASSDKHRHVSQWSRQLQDTLRPVDTMGLYSAEATELLLPRHTRDEAAERATALLAAAPKRSAPLLCGVATFPGAATSVEAMLDSCRRAVRAATPDRAVRCAPPDGARTILPGRTIDTDHGAPIVVSTAMAELFDVVDRLSRSAIPVVLYGETGTGKEILARAIHDRGPRKDKPMVCVNCGAIPSQLVESTLFGHEKGAFTGANQASEGILGAADGGTVLLDEIGELPASAQTALLRVLESKVISRVGSSRELKVDVRALAATHCDLEAMVEEGTFRRDLWYRLSAMVLNVPPLRERPEEIPPLAERFLADARADQDVAVTGITGAALRLLETYDWPGNVRELRNAIERAVVIAQGSEISAEDLPRRVRSIRSANESELLPPSAVGDAALLEESDEDLKSRVRSFEARLIRAALRATGGNQTEAAKLLKVPVRTLAHKVKSHDIDVRR